MYTTIKDLLEQKFELSRKIRAVRIVETRRNVAGLHTNRVEAPKAFQLLEKLDNVLASPYHRYDVVDDLLDLLEIELEPHLNTLGEDKS